MNKFYPSSFTDPLTLSRRSEITYKPVNQMTNDLLTK